MKDLTAILLLFLTMGIRNYVWSMGKMASCSDVSNLTVSFLPSPPYVINEQNTSPKGALSDFVKSILQKCFHQWKCDRSFTDVIWQRIDSSEDLLEIVGKKETDIAFTFPPSQQLPKFHNRVTFVNILKSPGFALIVDKENCQNAARENMWSNIISSWPIFLFTIILSCIFGVVMWMLEARSNAEEFPRSFLHGCYEGFWWAFISMTSVGYGDKVPRSVAGRFCGVVWILVGVVLLSVVTAAITSILTVSSVDNQCDKLQGKKIAVFNGSEAERIANHQGAAVTAYTSFDTMSQDVKLDIQDGIFLDQFRAYYYLSRHDRANLRVSKLTPHTLTYELAFVDRGRHLLPLRNNCFIERLESAHLRGEKFVKKYVNPVKSWEPATDNLGMFTTSSRTSQNMLLVSGCILLALLVFGTLWELFHNHRKCNCGLSRSIPRQRLRNYSNTEHVRMEPTQDSLMKKVNVVEESLNSLTAEIQQLKAELQVFANTGQETHKENGGQEITS